MKYTAIILASLIFTACGTERDADQDSPAQVQTEDGEALYNNGESYVELVELCQIDDDTGSVLRRLDFETNQMYVWISCYGFESCPNSDIEFNPSSIEATKVRYCPEKL